MAGATVEISAQAMERWRSMPDDAFPDFREARSGPARRLAEMPRSGTGVWIICSPCNSRRWVGGKELCQRWPAWLLRSQLAWAEALRCEDCGAKRFAVHPAADPGANGFQTSTQDTAPVIAARRLSAWLTGTRVSWEEVAEHLSSMPTRAERAALQRRLALSERKPPANPHQRLACLCRLRPVRCSAESGCRAGRPDCRREGQPVGGQTAVPMRRLPWPSDLLS